MPAKDAGFYSVVFTGADGEHTAELTYAGGWNDERAEQWARHKFGEAFKSIKRSSPDQHEQLVADNIAANPSRTPIDEKTGGIPNRVISDPSLLENP